MEVWYFGDGETCAPTFGRGFFFLRPPYEDGHGVPCPYGLGLCLSRCHIATFSWM